MLESSQRVVRLALRQFELGGLDVNQLTSGLRLGQDSQMGFADWNQVARLFERAEEAAAGPHRIEQLCEGVIRRALPEATALMALAPDMVVGSQLINTYADSSFFSHLRYPAMKLIGDRRLALTLRIPQRSGFEGCPAFFRAMAGVLRSSSAFAGQAPSTVDAHIEPFVAHYELTLPTVHQQAFDPTQEAMQRAMFQSWQERLGGLRTGLLWQRDNELRALHASTFSTLSAAVAGALLARESSAMPAAAATAIQAVLGCSRVVIRKVTAAHPAGVTLAACGPKVPRLVTFETQQRDVLILISADVERSSAAAGALEQLTPWLGMVLGAEPPSAPAPGSTEDANAARLATVTEQWRLTARQAQVAWLMIRGESNKSIASMLGCAEGTVELHAHAILKKAAVASRALLIRKFFTDS